MILFSLKSRRCELEISNLIKPRFCSRSSWCGCVEVSSHGYLCFQFFPPLLILMLFFETLLVLSVRPSVRPFDVFSVNELFGAPCLCGCGIVDHLCPCFCPLTRIWGSCGLIFPFLILSFLLRTRKYIRGFVRRSICLSVFPSVITSQKVVKRVF